MGATNREELEDLGAIVTGASSGIGRAVARQLAGRGAAVALWARRADVLEDVALELGERTVAVPCDVTDPAAVERALDRSLEAIGPIDALVNAAGLAEPLTLRELEPELWGRTIAANLDGTFFPTRAVARAWRAAGRSGSIVNLGSELSSMGMPSYAAYCASKAGVIGLTKAMAAELAPEIRVNALCPGPVDTPMLHAELALSGDAAAALAGEHVRVPLGRIASADEIANAVIWLLTDATFATGALIPIDGGTTSCEKTAV